MHKALLALSISLAAATAAAGDIDYSEGILFINEDWYGHQNSTVNYLLPDAPDGECWHYRVIQAENPGHELGCTNQYGALWDGRLYMIAKQEKDPGASITGGRISVADATTMKLVKQLEIIDPSGHQCDGRGFVGVDAHKGYVSTSNGIWVLDLDRLEITGQVDGSANPNAGGDNDKPNDDPTGALYVGQSGSMILAAGRVFAVHQQYGLLVIDPAQDRVVRVLDMKIVDEAVEAATGTAPKRGAGIGSGLVRAKDGSLWHSVAADVRGTGATLPYIVRVDPVTLDRELVKIEGEGLFPPSNSWYAWTPDPFCASEQENTLYWCGGSNRWFSKDRVFRFDCDTRAVTEFLDFSSQAGDWQVYGCSLGIHPVTDELYMSMFHQFTTPVYETRRYSSAGELLRTYAMIDNYWFPSLPVFPQSSRITGVTDIASGTHSDGPVTAWTLSGIEVFEGTADGWQDASRALAPGIYILRTSAGTRKITISN